MVSHELVRWATTFLIDAAELDWSYILQFWDPNQHFGERMTENLNQTLHTDTAKTVRPAASPWVLLVIITWVRFAFAILLSTQTSKTSKPE